MNDLEKKLLESIERPAFVKNKVGTYIGCNSSFEKFLDISKNKILGQTAFEIAPVALANIYSAADAALYKARFSQIYKTVVSTADQTQSVVFHKTIFLGKLDEVAGFIGIISGAEPAPTLSLESLKGDGANIGLT